VRRFAALLLLNSKKETAERSSANSHKTGMASRAKEEERPAFNAGQLPRKKMPEYYSGVINEERR